MTASEPVTERGAGRTKPTVSIVIPAFNEAARIGESIRSIETFLETFSFDADVIVVDDGSTDETSRIVHQLQFPRLRLITNRVNHGKGYAVKCGVLEATGDYVLFSDADLSAPIEELEKLMPVALEKDADVVVGSRGMDRRYIQKHQSPMREFGGIVFNFAVRLMLGLRIYDTQCGFKLFKRATVTSVFRKQTIDGFGFDPELLFLASQSGLKIIEVPVRWSHAEGSKVRFSRDAVRMLCDIARVRWNQLTGRYS
jgi:glycosyltransferase involved in cell wall biosynthesis